MSIFLFHSMALFHFAIPGPYFPSKGCVTAGKELRPNRSKRIKTEAEEKQEKLNLSKLTSFSVKRVVKLQIRHKIENANSSKNDRNFVNSPQLLKLCPKEEFSVKTPRTIKAALAHFAKWNFLEFYVKLCEKLGMDQKKSRKFRQTT